MEKIKSFIQSHSFATVVTTMNEKPIATHIPVSFHQVGDSYVISGHMAIGNPQWKTFEESEKTLVIFQGRMPTYLLHGMKRSSTNMELPGCSCLWKGGTA